jgi:hypothetical protein
VESPSTWNLLTSALAMVGLDDVDRAWAFMMHLGLLGNRRDVRARFDRAIAAVKAEGEITGPSRSARVAVRLSDGRDTNAQRTMQPDPDGKIARAQFAEFLKSGAAPAFADPPYGDCFCRRCGTATSIKRPCIACKQEPIDAVALAIELGLSDATFAMCRRCARAHRFEPFCYYCGLALT